MKLLSATLSALIAMGLFAIGNAFAEDANGSTSALIVVADQRKSSAFETEECIRNNAFKVEAAIADLAQATKFLVEDIRAVPISKENGERMAKQAEAANAQWKKMCDDEKTAKEASKSKITGTLRLDAR